MADNIEPDQFARGEPSHIERPPCARTMKRRRQRFIALQRLIYSGNDFMKNVILPDNLRSKQNSVRWVRSKQRDGDDVSSMQQGQRPEIPGDDDDDDDDDDDERESVASRRIMEGIDDNLETSAVQGGNNAERLGVDVTARNTDTDANDNAESTQGYGEENEMILDCTDKDGSGISDSSDNDSLRTWDGMNDSASVDFNDRNGSDISMSSRESTNNSTESSGNDSSQEEESENDEPEGSFNAQGMDNLLQIVTMRPHVPESQLLAMIIAVSTLHRLTYEATVSLLKMMSSITNGSKLPKTMRGLWAILLNGVELAIVRHWFCRSCKWYLGTDQTLPLSCSCKENESEKDRMKLKSYFIQVPLTPQLKQLLSQPGIANSLLYRYERAKKEAENIEDIYDGFEYCKLSESGGFLHDKNNFSLTINTDGCKVSESSNASAWPVLLTINELPLHLRKRHVLLAGVWVETVHPSMNMILSPIVDELKMLYETGVTWRPNGTDEVTSRFITPICIADSPARCAILRMTQFNGLFGCTYCLHKGIGKGGKRVYPIQDVTLRTDEEIRRQMDEAFLTRQRVCGVRGYTIMSVLPAYDLAKGAPVDPMHNICLGVMRLHVMLLLYGNATDPWYNGQPNKLSALDAILLKIRPPGRISRKPRSIKNAKLYKASEWRNLLLYYILCFEGTVRPCDFQLLTLLSRAAHLLYQDSISINDLQEAKSLLLGYVKGFEREYTVDNMTYNIHLLNHLATSVEDWGPLWANTAFPFESYNKKIIDSVTSANSRPTQIVTRFLMHRFMQFHMYDTRVEPRTRQLVYSILNSGKRHKPAQYEETDPHQVGNDFKGLGRVIMAQPKTWQSRILLDAHYEPQNVLFFKGAKINGIEYRCRGDREQTRSCNKFVCTTDNKIGEILHIIQFRHDEHTVNGLIIDVLADDCIFGESRHIRKLSPREKSGVFIETNNFEVPVVMIFVNNNAYGVKMPNVWEAD